MSNTTFTDYLQSHPDHSDYFTELNTIGTGTIGTPEITTHTLGVKPWCFKDNTNGDVIHLIPKCASIYLRAMILVANRTHEVQYGETRFTRIQHDSDDRRNATRSIFFIRNPYDRYLSACKYQWIGSDFLPTGGGKTEAAYVNYPDWRNWGGTAMWDWDAHWFPVSWFLPSTGTYSEPNDWVSNLSVDVSSENVYVKMETADYKVQADALGISSLISLDNAEQMPRNRSHDMDMDRVNTDLIHEITARDVEIYNTLPAFSA